MLYFTDNSTDTNCIAFFIFESTIVAIYENQALYVVMVHSTKIIRSFA